MFVVDVDELVKDEHLSDENKNKANKIKTEIYNFINKINDEEGIDANFAMVVFGLNPVTVMELTDGSKITNENYIVDKIQNNQDINSISGVINL